METTQNFANEVADISVVVEAERKRIVDENTPPDWRHEYYIGYRACGGMIIEYDETTGNNRIRKMTMRECAEKVGVTPQTLRDWQNLIPDFWGRVSKRRAEIGSQARLELMEQKWFTKALAMEDWRITEAWLRHYKPDYKEPRAKVEHEAGNSWVALLRAKQNAIEGEIINGSNNALVPPNEPAGAGNNGSHNPTIN